MNYFLFDFVYLFSALKKTVSISMIFEWFNYRIFDGEWNEVEWDIREWNEVIRYFCDGMQKIKRLVDVSFQQN